MSNVLELPDGKRVGFLNPVVIMSVKEVLDLIIQFYDLSLDSFMEDSEKLGHTD